MIAHVNTAGAHIPLWVVAQNPNVGWGLDESYPNQEGTFFGNIFTLGAHGTDATKVPAYYCHGSAWDTAVVPGRIGANQTNAPYTNAFSSGTGYCKDYCTAADYPNAQSGFKACNGWNNVITTYRQAGGSTATGGVAGSTLAGSNLTATVVTYDQYAGGYCANINIKNNGTVATNAWTVKYDIGNATHKWAWRTQETIAGSVHTAKSTPDNSAIAPGATVHFGFCANTGTGATPIIKAVSTL
jgi:hypothetical protein